MEMPCIAGEDFNQAIQKPIKENNVQDAACSFDCGVLEIPQRKLFFSTSFTGEFTISSALMRFKDFLNGLYDCLYYYSHMCCYLEC